MFDAQYLRKFRPLMFNSFEFLPSVGNSGGSIIIWEDRKFSGQMVFQNEFAQNVEFKCVLFGISWVLTNIYAPCTHEGKLRFLHWFKNISMPNDYHWLIVGDFNLLRSPGNRNKLGETYKKCWLSMKQSIGLV